MIHEDFIHYEICEIDGNILLMAGHGRNQTTIGSWRNDSESNRRSQPATSRVHASNSVPAGRGTNLPQLPGDRFPGRD